MNSTYKSNASKMSTERKKKWREENPEKYRAELARTRSKEYNITLDEFYCLYEKSCGKCFICEKPSTNFRRGLHIDHNHKTGVVRGLLCPRCNRTIGVVGESIEILKKMIDYLEKNS